MTIKRMGGSWGVSVQKGGTRWRRQFREHGDAELWEAQAKVALLAGTPCPGEKVYTQQGGGGEVYTLFDLATYQEKHHWSTLKNGEKQIEMVGQVLTLLGGGLTPVRDLRRQDIDEMVDELRKKGNAGGTINRKLSCLSGMLTTAVGLGVIPARIKLPWQPRGEARTRSLRDEELALIFQGMEEAGHTNEAAYFRFLLETGLRRSEAQHLRWTDVDLPGRAVTVTHTKTKRTRHVPLSKKALALLETRCSSSVSTPWGDIETQAATAAWVVGRRAANLLEDSEAVPHTLRHTFATRLAGRGIDLITLRDLLGHTTVEQTMRYAHSTSTSFARARKLLDDDCS